MSTSSTTSTISTTAALGSMWTIDKTDVKLNPDYYLQTELGVALRAIQDKNSIEAIKKPEVFIQNRSDRIAALFKNGSADGPVTAAFNTRYAELTALQLPEEVARSMAKKAALRVYNEELEILELQAPDAYTKAFGIASVDHNAKLEKNDIAGTGINEHDVIAKYKSYKRAKKASKKSQK